MSNTLSLPKLDAYLSGASLDKLRESEEFKPRTANQLEVGDAVVISGNVNFKEQTGEITRFGKNKHFVVVKLHGGGEHSFHSSDVSELDTSHEDTDDEKKSDANKFYVAFYDNAEERSWIGVISKEHGGKWHEKAYKGKPEMRWGQTYMSYLTPDDIMNWIHKDYHRGIEIEGPFMSPEEAEEHVKQNWGRIEESVITEAQSSEELEKAIKHLEKLLSSMRKKKLSSTYQPQQEKDILAGEKELKKLKAALEKSKKTRGKLEKTNEEAYTNYSDWKQSVLLSNPVQAKNIKFRGKMEGTKTTVIACIPGQERIYGIWDDAVESGTVLSEDGVINEDGGERMAAQMAKHMLGSPDVEMIYGDNEDFDVIMNGAKHQAHKYVDTVNGPWVLTHYKKGTKDFVKVDPPKGSSKKTAFYVPV